MFEVKIKKVHPDAVLPKFAHDGDAGMDLYSVENLILKPQHRAKIKTGIAMELPNDFVILILDKSGVSLKGIKTLGGVIDPIYRGEMHVTLINLSSKNFEIKKGQKIAQILIQKIERPKLVEVDELSETQRGVNGFGSTGKF